MQILTVVNRMLATMGELPLASLTDNHALLSTAQDKLEQVSREVQSDGWWFNMEELRFTPSPIDSNIYLPNDALEVRTEQYNLVKRGQRIYNLQGGTYVFPTYLDVILLREVGFEDLPEVAAGYIAARAVLGFQTDYDGDVAKARTLAEDVRLNLIQINAANTRNRKVNFVASNVRLARLKRYTSQARRFIST